MNQLDVMLAMQDDAFKVILQKDEVINELEKQKYNPTLEFNELMSILSKIYKINGIVVQALTPAVWSFLYAIDNAYTKKDKVVQKIDTDVFMYVISNGISNLKQDLITSAAGFCDQHGIDYEQTESDIKSLIYLMFRPLQMFNSFINNSEDKQEVRFNADWVTRIVSVVCPLTNKTSDDVIFNMSLTECFYYFVQNARKYDDKDLIKRKNSDQIEAEIYRRTLDLGKEYYEKNYLKK